MIILSIITPVFSAESTILRCLESVSKLNLDNIEHLIIDGESNDNTLTIVRQFTLNNPQVKLVSSKDLGVYDAMNKGIDLAKGKWLYFLGADDEFILNDVLNVLSLHDSYELVYGNVRQVQYGKFVDTYGGEFDIQRIANHNICHQSIFYKRELFKRFGFYDINYKIYSDYKFNLTCFFTLKEDQIKYINKNIANYNLDGLSSKLEMNELIQIWSELQKKYNSILYRDTKKYILSHLIQFYSIISKKDFTSSKYISFMKSFILTIFFKIKLRLL
jgi:glycosyltransferase involved in cell wall biosynthesis